MGRSDGRRADGRLHRERPSSIRVGGASVFIAWDEEQVDVERRDIDTVRARTVVTARRTVVKRALWTNAITAETITSAEAYAASIADHHDNVRVLVVRK
jgi:hypothetical protein